MLSASDAQHSHPTASLPASVAANGYAIGDLELKVSPRGQLTYGRYGTRTVRGSPRGQLTYGRYGTRTHASQRRRGGNPAN
eukprot:2315405-Prymnesium_polylepis.1